MVDTSIWICYNLNAFTKCMEEYPSPVEGIGLENRQVEKSAQGFEKCMEEYPSPVEGIGLENRQVEKSAQGFESLFLRQFFRYRGMVAVW